MFTLIKAEGSKHSCYLSVRKWKGRECVIKHRLILPQGSLKKPQTTKPKPNQEIEAVSYVVGCTGSQSSAQLWQWSNSTRWAFTSSFLFIAHGGWQLSMWNLFMADLSVVCKQRSGIMNVHLSKMLKHPLWRKKDVSAECRVKKENVNTLERASSKCSSLKINLRQTGKCDRRNKVQSRASF